MLDNNENALELRKKYHEFIYDSFFVLEDNENIYIKYKFIISDLITFEPSITIKKKNYIKEKINNNKYLENIAFNIGLVESISYWKATMAPEYVIKCGFLDKIQEEWWRKLFFNGLGELRYRNKINLALEEFVNFKSLGTSYRLEKIKESYSNYIFPVGGGKDSVVTIDILNNNDNNYAFIINPKKPTLECAKIAGFTDDHIIEVERKLDRKIVDLNNQGFINGHTPFSSIVSFISYLCSYLMHIGNIALSNEDSANESNTDELNINHQYSKTLEYENDFRWYADNYLCVPTNYFSFLRPVNEFSIAKMFSKLEKYHRIFKSCNLGSKGEEWVWCNNCPKCLFVFTILSPFLYKDKLINIFGEDLFARKDLLETFIDLSGHGKLKPFECVGTFEEVRYAISLTISKYDGRLPYLLEYYKNNYELENLNTGIDKHFNTNNNLSNFEKDILRRRLLDD